MSVMNRLNVERILNNGRRTSGGRFITGIEELDKKLGQLKISVANKIARPALAKAARMLLKKMKAQVPPQYKDAKKGLGMVVDSKGGSNRKQPRAKVGAGVGMTAKKVEKAQSKQKDRSGRSGVGMGVKNIHWFILGTDDRTQKKSGRSTGKMAPVMPGLVKDTTAQCQMEMMRIIRDEVSLRLDVLANQGA